MHTINEPILGLYDTWLGKFSFFRKLVKILLEFRLDFQKLHELVDNNQKEMSERLDEAIQKISEQEKEILSLKSAFPKQSISSNHKTAHGIMDSFYDSLNPTNNA